jgi:septum formation protein
MRLLLGSNSPRRNELLKLMGFDFDKVAIDCDEDFDSDMPVTQVAEYLAHKKSKAYSTLKNDDILITADTVVICKNKILNKPTNKVEAVQMLTLLSNTTHFVETGYCIRSVHKTVSATCTTEVTVGHLSAEVINHYIDYYKPYDKAGAYGIQEWFGLTQVTKINGCYFNVVGLPCSEIYHRLKSEYGI